MMNPSPLNSWRQRGICLVMIGLLQVLMPMGTAIATPSLPPPDDIPEEILRNGVITTARSPLDGSPMTAAAYAELQVDLATPPPAPPEVGSELRKVVNLLKLRRFLKTFFPFIPIK
jgi:hypothetical protein